MDKATPAAMKEMKEMFHVMKYLQQTKDHGLKLAPTTTALDQQWQLSIYSDSDWASDKNGRKSVTGFTIFLQLCGNRNLRRLSLSQVQKLNTMQWQQQQKK
jgi:hypothetical protein